MSASRNIIQGAAGGLIGGAVLGVAEAAWLISSSGAPDLRAPVYAAVLYGGIGLPLGIAGGVALMAWERLRRPVRDPIAFATGAAAAVAPIAVFVLFYLVNKEVYAEQGIPTVGKLGILGVVALLAFGLLTAGARIVQSSMPFLLRGPGALGTWAALVAVTGAASFIPVGDDPRATWAHGKQVPSGLADKPNVLLIAVDTLRADHLGTYGMGGEISPTFDAIAKDGVVFEQHLAHASWTRSSFASLFSSRLPSSHNADTKAARLADEVEILSEVLQAGGVTTGNLANNINVTSTFNFDQGYDTFIYESPVYPFFATESVFGLTLYKVVHKLSERIGPKIGIGKSVETFYQPAEVVLADAKGFIDANKDARWYLGVHLMEPHDPYFEHPYLMGQGTDEFNGKGYARAEHEHPDPNDAEYLKKVYIDEIRHLDRKLKPFIDGLKASGAYDNTMIVITADHGEEFHEHGGFWHGTTLYDEQIRIPLIVKLPKAELAGTRVSWQSRAIDVAPTIAAALGLKPSDQWQGQDLLADVRAEIGEAAARREQLAQAEQALASAQAAVAAAPADPLLVATVTVAEAAVAALKAPADACAAYNRSRQRVAIAEEDFEGNVLSAIRNGAFKYLRAAEGNPRGLPTEELFDVIADAGETKNLVGSSANPCGTYVSDLPQKLGEQMGEEVKKAVAGGAAGGSAELSAAEIAKLCALGYMSGPDCEK